MCCIIAERSYTSCSVVRKEETQSSSIHSSRTGQVIQCPWRPKDGGFAMLLVHVDVMSVLVPGLRERNIHKSLS